jgi:DNA-binding response OmpR family regulator
MQALALGIVIMYWEENAVDTKDKTRLLLVEDDEDLSVVTAMQLKRRGFEVRKAMTGEDAMKLIQEERIDLVLLDVMLPDYDGHELCRMFRGEDCDYQGPIIFMSCLGDGGNIVEAFRGGGNDYVIKPVEIGQLTERIHVNLAEHAGARHPQKKQWFKQFMIDRKMYEVYQVKNGQLGDKLDLSPTEYKLLDLMTRMPDEVMLYRQIYQKIWGQDDLDDYRTLMVHMSNLRKKINAAHTEVIRSVRGVGYIFQDV